MHETACREQAGHMRAGATSDNFVGRGSPPYPPISYISLTSLYYIDFYTLIYKYIIIYIAMLHGI